MRRRWSVSMIPEAMLSHTGCLLVQVHELQSQMCGALPSHAHTFANLPCGQAHTQLATQENFTMLAVAVL